MINFSEIPPNFKAGKKHIFKVSISDTFIERQSEKNRVPPGDF